MGVILGPVVTGARGCTTGPGGRNLIADGWPSTLCADSGENSLEGI